MKLKYQFVFQEVGTMYMGVAVGESASLFHGMLQLNDVGHDIVKMMAEETTKEEIVSNMLSIYDTDRETVSKYVDEVMDYLKAEGVLI